MINIKNYKNEVLNLWENYTKQINDIKLNINKIRDNINLSDEGKRNDIEFFKKRIKDCNINLGNKLIQYLQEGIEYTNNKALKPIDTKKLLDITALLKENGKILSDDEILSLTREFHENSIAIKTINSVLGKHVLRELPTTEITKNIDIAKNHIQQAIGSSENDDQGMMMPFQGWKVNCQIVDIAINNIPDKL